MRREPTRPRYEPIAIIGLGCRFAGGVDCPDALWEVLRQGRDLVTEVPPDRWDSGQAYDPEPGVPGRTVSKWGGFLSDVLGFDPEAFGISEREAEAMDPQHRLLLMTSWEALEHAGVPPRDIGGSPTGVFFGVSSQDYLMQTPYQALLANPYAMTGNARSMAAGRISYLLGLRGPSVVLDSACSSSLVATHLAARSLHSGDCDLALAGGVNLIFGPESTVAFSSWGMLSPAGRCRAFDADASGFVRAEACGVVALKRLADAERDGDRVLAVLRGSGVNQDGRSNGITAPSRDAQEELQRQVIARAGVDPSQVGLVEAHGTGTPVGDPVEFAALSATYGAGRSPCALGSVKTNVGHAETASGMAGLSKAILALRHGLIPANLHFQRWNDEIRADGTRLFVPTVLTPWPVPDGPRLAAVSSYGFSGTNAHVLVEQAPADAPLIDAPVLDASSLDTSSLDATSGGEPTLVPISATSPDALRTTALRVADWVARQPAYRLADIGYTLARRRTHRSARATVAARDHAGLVAGLRLVADGQPGPGVSEGSAAGETGAVWVFSGQGSQWAGMGQVLLAEEPAFAAVIDELEPLVASESGFSVRAALESPEVVTGIDRVQPVLFAVQVALAATWRAYGATPAAVIGHSMGEAAAAVVAGALSLADGARVICRRSTLLRELSGDGAMASVDLPAEQVERELSGAGVTDVVVAVHTSPESTVVSGDASQVRDLVAEWDRRGQLAREIAVDVASHSPQVDPILDRLVERLRGLDPGTPAVPFHSTVRDGITDAPKFDAAYWSENLRRPVRFADAVSTALSAGHRRFVEVSPHPLLTHAIGETGRHHGTDVVALPTLRRDDDERLTFLTHLGAAHCAGAPVDWSRLHPRGRLVDVPLPAWANRPLSMPAGPASPVAAGHPLLGVHVRVPDAEGEHLWQTDVGTRAQPWLTEHQVRGSAAMPAAGYGEVALGAARELFGRDRGTEVVDLRFDNLLLLDEEVHLSTSVLERGRDEAELRVLTDGEDGDTTVHASAVLRASDSAVAPAIDVDKLLAQHPEPFDPDRFYAHLRDCGIEHGPGFTALARLHRAAAGEDSVLSEVRLPAARRADSPSYVAHPVLLDACLQTLAAHPDMMAQSGLFLPLGIGSLRVTGRPDGARYCLARLYEVGDRQSVGEFQLLTADGEVVVEGQDVRFGTRSGDDDVERLHEQRLLTVTWERVPPPPPAAAAPGGWLLVAEPASEEVASALADGIRTRGGEATLLVEPLGTAHEDDLRRSVAGHLDSRDVRGVVVVQPPHPADEDAAAERAEQRVGQVVAVAQAMTDQAGSAPPRLTVLAHGGQPVTPDDTVNLEQAPLRGLCRVIAHEHPELRATVVDATSTDLSNLVGELLDGPADQDEVAWRDGERHLARLAAAPLTERERQVTTATLGRDGVAVQVARKGDLDTLELATRSRRAPGAGEVEIEIRAASLNYADALNAMDLYHSVDNTPPPLGADCAGVVVRVGPDVTDVRAGDRVTAVMWGSLASHLTVARHKVLQVPGHLSFEEAATMPAVYLTAWYALHYLARLGPGERVLIHSATGGVGRAAVEIARMKGAEVFATAGTEAKRDQLRELGIHHVADSRTVEFAEQFRAATDGEGVDVVLNSLVGPAQRAGLSLLRTGGRFLEIGKRDIYAGHRLNLVPFRRNITFASIDLGLVVTELDQLTGELLGGLGAEIAAGRLPALPYTVYDVDQLSEAFRTLAAGRHTGKLVVRLPHEGTRQVPVPPEEVRVVRPEGGYVVTGGLGGLGLLLARRLADAGAARIVLNGRSEPGAEAQRVIDELRGAGADVRVVRGDVAEPGTADRLLAEATTGGVPLRGVAHAAAVIEDAVVARLDGAVRGRVWHPKVTGAWRLHRALQDGPHERGLDWFLLFSSAATLIGNPGQGAYAAANGWLDGLASYRRSRGLVATSVAWGAWAEHGRGAGMADRGFAMIRPAEGVDACDLILRHARSRTGYLPVRGEGWLDAVGPRAASSSFFAAFAQHRSRTDDGGEEDAELLAELRAADADTRRDLLTRFLVQNAAAILRLDPAGVQPSRPLLEYGLDSLMGLELRTRIASRLGVRVPTKALWSNPEPTSLAGYLMDRLNLSDE